MYVVRRIAPRSDLVGLSCGGRKQNIALANGQMPFSHRSMHFLHKSAAPNHQ
jgi:hypothetical protein